MNEVYILLLFLAVGYLTGVLIGMLGIGGGIVFVPFLHFFLPQLGVPEITLMHSAIGTALLSGALASSNSALFHIKYKNALTRKAFLVGIGSVTTAFITPFFVVKIKSDVLEFIFAVVLLLVAIKMFFHSNDSNKGFLSNPLKDCWLVVLGLFVGVLSAFTGLGGGIVYVPALIFLFLLNTKNAVGTSSVITAVTMISSSISYFLIGSVFSRSEAGLGFVQFNAALTLGFGAIIGSFSGVKLTVKSSSKIIKRIFSIIIFVAVIRIFWNLF